MGSGPIIIADDGSPPPGAFQPLPRSGMRIARYDRPMTELNDGRKCFALHRTTITGVTVTKNGTDVFDKLTPALVMVSGLATTLTVEQAGGDVRVCTDMDLDDNVSNNAHWRRSLARNEALIRTVEVDGTVEVQNSGNDMIRVIVDLNP